MKFYETLNRLGWLNPNYQQSRGGTMTKRTKQERLAAARVIGTGTSRSATQSGVPSMDSCNVVGSELSVDPSFTFPPVSFMRTKSEIPAKTPTKTYPSFGIESTPCCGMHTVNGFQYDPDPDPVDFIIGLHHSYAHNMEHNSVITQEVKDCVLEKRAPRIICVKKPTTIPGMLVFTWNSTAYVHSAKKIQSFIVENHLGECFFTGWVINPNSGHRIQAMTWCINGPEYHKFIQTNIPCSEG